MSTNQVQEGRQIDVTVGAAVSSGAIWRGTGMCGVYVNSGVTGDVVPVAVEGVFDVLKDAMGTAVTQGMQLYANSSLEATPTGTGGIPLGHAAAAAATGAVVARVKLGTF